MTVSGMRRRVLATRALALLAVLYAAAFYAVGAAMKPGYSSVSQFISELNATGTAQAEALGRYGFLPVALLTAAFLVLFVVMVDPRLAPVRGLLQRIADALLGASLLVVALRIARDDPA